MLIKKVRKVGNGLGLLFDRAICEMAGITEGTEVIILFADGKLTIEPYSADSHKRLVSQVHKDVMRSHRKTLKKLADS